MTASADVATHIRRMRTALGLNQADFARHLGVAVGSVSKIENGRMALTDDLLSSIAQTLDCSRAFLADGDQDVPVSRPWLRAYADASKRTVDQQIADSIIAAEFIEGMRLRRVPETLPVFDGDLTDDGEIEEFANDVREVAHISEGDVAGNVIRAAERLGCVVLPMAEELGRHLGISLRVNTMPVIRVSRPSRDPGRHVPGDRQRWTVAHEIGHLAMHTSHGPPQSSEEATRMEKQAHRFAGAFLAPGDAILQDLDQFGWRVTLRTLAKIKERWGVSIKGLVMRFRALGVIDESQARSLHKQISARGWNKGEPIAVGNESAVWLRKAIDKSAGGDPDPVTACAQAAGIGRAYVERWIDWSPTAFDTAEASVVRFPEPSNRTTATEPHGGGSVTNLPVRSGP